MRLLLVIFFHSFYLIIYDAVGLWGYVDVVTQHQNILGLLLYNSVRTE